MGQALGEAFDDPDFPLILEELKKDMTVESEDSEICASVPSPMQSNDQRVLTDVSACQPPSSLPPAGNNCDNGPTEASNVGDAEDQSLTTEYHDDLHKQMANIELEVREEKDDDHSECVDQKLTNAVLAFSSDSLIYADKDEVVKIPKKPELIPLIKVERCDDMLDASDCLKLNTGKTDDEISADCQRGRPQNVVSLWKTCHQKIKRAQMEKTKSKVDLPPPISELEQFDFYKNKELCIKKLNKKKEILEEDGKKEYSVENLLFLKNMQYRYSSRRKKSKLSLPKVECQLCHEELSRKRFEHAFLIHGVEYKNTCPVCLEKDLSNVEAHFRTTHFNDVPLSCHLCSTVCYSGKDLRKHVVCHQTMNPLTCEVCEFHFTSEEELKAHRSQHHRTNWEVKVKKTKKPKPPMLFEGTCETCGHLLRGRSEHDLRSRIIAHKKKLHMEKLKCPMCDKKFHHYHDLAKHNLRVHTPDDQRPFICPFENCGKGFKTGYNLKSHQRYHKPPQFKCDKCNKTFFWPVVWRKHKCRAA